MGKNNAFGFSEQKFDVNLLFGYGFVLLSRQEGVFLFINYTFYVSLEYIYFCL